MAGAPPRYSEEQREAVIAAAIEGRLSAAAALELAKAGKLAGLPPFSPSYDQVTEWVRQRKRDIQAKTPPAPDDYDAMSRRLWAQHVAEVDRLERELRRRKRTDAEKDRLSRQLTETIKRHREARALVASLPKGEETPAPKEEPKDLFARLAETEPTGESEAKHGDHGQTDDHDEERTEAKNGSDGGDKDSGPADTHTQGSPAQLATMIRPDLQTPPVEAAA